MLLIVTLFLAASLLLPAAEGIVVTHVSDLPFGLSRISWIANLTLIAAALVVSFLICCLIYWAVPKGHMPWRAVWPGALFVTLVTGVANWAFPFYLTNISSLHKLGGTIGFILIALLWFYALALALLAGAVINAIRFEIHDTGTLDTWEEEAVSASAAPPVAPASLPDAAPVEDDVSRTGPR
jgi:uncharacterized BrkB/YihY/UPF0761 family membrane protein